MGAAGGELGAAGRTGLDQAVDLAELGTVDERAEMDLLAVRVADREGVGPGGQPVDVLVVQRRVDQVPAVMQTWPWWKNDPQAAVEITASRSASSSTMSAELPPSSRWARFRWRPAASPTARPAPVKEMTGMRGSATSAWPASGPPGRTCRTCSTPSGSPASANTAASARPPQTAVRGSGLSTTALPRAGATERIERISGALNGAITPTTPTGTRRV